jgi:hypothetical protein
MVGGCLAYRVKRKSQRLDGLTGHRDPNGECVYNISKETTSRELCDIQGIPEEIFRKQNMNLCGGHVNAIEYCSAMFGFPDMFELMDEWEKDHVTIDV